MRLQIAANQGQTLLNKPVHIGRGQYEQDAKCEPPLRGAGRQVREDKFLLVWGLALILS